MKNSWKVAKWEIRRNLKNKTFLVSIFLTPVLFLLFAFLPNVISSFDSGEEAYTLHVQDEIGIFPQLEDSVTQMGEHIAVQQIDDSPSILEEIKEDKTQGVLVLDQQALSEHRVTLYQGGEESPNIDLQHLQAVINHLFQQHTLTELGVSAEDVAMVQREVMLEQQNLVEDTADPMTRIIPGAFAGIILFGVVMSGMTTFTSSTQEKKDKISEILLSSVSSTDLMQGKIWGYFILGIVQVFVWLAFGIPTAQIYFDIPVTDYLFEPKLLLLLVYAIGGYLLFSSIFVAIGATLDDMNTAGNFVGFIFMLPFLPLVFIGSIIGNPNGIIAQIVSYIPITTPSVMVMRLTFSNDIPILEIILTLALLVVSIWAAMKLAGKVYRTGMLIYGKNATPQEIIKWLRE